MAKGFGGMPGNMQSLMKQAQKMQSELQKVQEESEGFTGEGSAGGGMVKVEAQKGKLLSIEISPEVVNSDDIEMLQDLIMAAVNEAIAKVEENARKKMEQITGGLNLPGLF